MKKAEEITPAEYSGSEYAYAFGVLSARIEALYEWMGNYDNVDALRKEIHWIFDPIMQ